MKLDLAQEAVAKLNKNGHRKVVQILGDVYYKELYYFFRRDSW